MYVVWISRINPIARGCFIRQNVSPSLKIKNIKNICRITENSLIKILVLGTDDGVYYFFSEVLRKRIHLRFTRPLFLLNY